MKPGALLCLWNARSYLIHQKLKEHHAMDGRTVLLLPSRLQLEIWGSEVLFFTVFPLTGGGGNHTWLLLNISTNTYLHWLLLL